MGERSGDGKEKRGRTFAVFLALEEGEGAVEGRRKEINCQTWQFSIVPPSSIFLATFEGEKRVGGRERDWWDLTALFWALAFPFPPPPSLPPKCEELSLSLWTTKRDKERRKLSKRFMKWGGGGGEVDEKVSLGERKRMAKKSNKLIHNSWHQPTQLEKKNTRQCV